MSLIDYCESDYQRRVIELYEQGYSDVDGAKEMGVLRTNFSRSKRRVRARATMQGDRPEHNMTHPVPDPHKVKRHSVNYVDGVVKQEWVISEPDKERQLELMREAVEELSRSVPPAPPQPAPKTCRDHLLSCYILTDYHLGMLAWHEEGGDDWDLDIAEDLLSKWFSAAVAAAPASHTGVLAQIGDFLHWDGLDAITPTSGNVLDADTRWQKLVRAAIRALRSVVDQMLTKHKQVHLIMAEGNHDLASSAWLREMFAALYEQEPRVTVDCNPDPYYCYEWGDTSLFFHHGHKAKLDSLGTVMASKFREAFGRTKFSYGHSGHLHHKKVQETPLMIWEQHTTLAAHDAHASRSGYGSKRSAPVITYSRDQGEVGRVEITPEMVQNS